MLRSSVPHFIQWLTQSGQIDSPQEGGLVGRPLLHLSGWVAMPVLLRSLNYDLAHIKFTFVSYCNIWHTAIATYSRSLLIGVLLKGTSVSLLVTQGNASAVEQFLRGARPCCNHTLHVMLSKRVYKRSRLTSHSSLLCCCCFLNHTISLDAFKIYRAAILQTFTASRF